MFTAVRLFPFRCTAIQSQMSPLNVRRANRVAALQFLYMWDLNPPEELAAEVRRFFSEQEQPRDYFSFAEELVHGVVSHADSIDEAIRQHAENWEFSRIARIDLAILRLAIYELLHRRDIPPVVTINEAVELSKEFSVHEAKRFINGILDRIKGTLDRPLRSPAED